MERVELRSLFACFGFSHVNGSEKRESEGLEHGSGTGTAKLCGGGGGGGALGCRSFILVFVGWLGTVWNLGIKVSWGGNGGLGGGIKGTA